MKVIGLVTVTRPEKLPLMLRSLSDCDDIIVIEDLERRGMAWARNKLMSLAPDGSIVRFVDDDDIAFSTRRMAERLVEKNLDVLAASYIVQNHRVEVPSCPISACINRVGSWSWVAKIDSIRDIEWDASRRVMSGTWQWLKFIDHGLNLGMAPDIWCYHWIPAENGITAQFASYPTFDLYEELLRLIETRGSIDDVMHLANRISYVERSNTVSNRYRDLLSVQSTDDMLYHKIRTYVKTRGEYMIGTKRSALTAAQCADVIQAATNVQFQRAAVRAADGSSFYHEAHRDSSVSFIQPADLATDTWTAIKDVIASLNEEYYKADIDVFNMQVAEYNEGQVGFDWHSDDPPYPSPGVIWSGRKLTYVFELSEATAYDGGYLDIEPYRVPKSVNSTNVNHNAHNIDIPNRIIVYANEPMSEVTPEMIINQDIRAPGVKRQQGDCTVFPSFFFHKVHPVSRGKRFSLTVWAKGPKWV